MESPLLYDLLLRLNPSYVPPDKEVLAGVLVEDVRVRMMESSNTAIPEDEPYNLCIADRMKVQPPVEYPYFYSSPFFQI